MSIQQFIIQSRIHAAIHALTTSGRTIAQVADQFGFSDQSAFTRRFVLPAFDPANRPEAVPAARTR